MRALARWYTGPQVARQQLLQIVVLAFEEDGSVFQNW